jgi:hypothetical protein
MAPTRHWRRNARAAAAWLPMSRTLPAYRLGHLDTGQPEGEDTTEKYCFRGAANPSLVPRHIPLLPHVQCHITDYHQWQELMSG